MDNYTTDSLELYLNTLKDHILTADEEKELFLKMKNGDLAAKQMIIESNLRLVVSIAKKYQGLGLELLDLIEEGNIGLMEAVDKFDLSYGNKFSTYATHWISKEVSSGVKNKAKNIRLPIHFRERIVSYYKTKIELQNKYKRVPTNEEIAKELNTTTNVVDELGKYNEDTLSLSTIVDYETGTELEDLIGTEDSVTEDLALKFELPMLIEKLFKQCKLTEREISIIKLRFGFVNNTSYTLDEVSEMLNLSREWVRRIQNKSIDKLSNSKYVMDLVDYLDKPDRTMKEKDNKSIVKDDKTKKTRKKAKSTDNLYTYFDEYSKEDVKEVLENLLPRHLEILHVRYGSDLEKPIFNSDVSREYKNLLYGSILPGIRKKLEAKNIGDSCEITKPKVLVKK